MDPLMQLLQLQMMITMEMQPKTTMRKNKVIEENYCSIHRWNLVYIYTFIFHLFTAVPDVPNGKNSKEEKLDEKSGNISLISNYLA